MLQSRTLVPPYSIAGDVGVVAIGAAVTAAAAQVTVPLPYVPFTLQTLAVMLCGLTLGARRGAASQIAYLMAGIAGLPVFAGSAGGAQYLFGMTGGYLWSFILVAAFLGWCADKGWDRKLVPFTLCLVGGIAMSLLVGASWLSVFVGPKTAFYTGVLPFMAVEPVKVVLAAIALPSARVLVSRFETKPWVLKRP